MAILILWWRTSLPMKFLSSKHSFIMIHSILMIQGCFKCKTLKITMHIVIYGSWDIYLLKLSQIDSNKVSKLCTIHCNIPLCCLQFYVLTYSHTHKCLWTEQLDHWKSSNLWLIPQCNTLLWLLVSYWQAQPPLSIYCVTLL